MVKKKYRNSSQSLWFTAALFETSVGNLPSSTLSEASGLAAASLCTSDPSKALKSMEIQGSQCLLWPTEHVFTLINKITMFFPSYKTLGSYDPRSRPGPPKPLAETCQWLELGCNLREGVLRGFTSAYSEAIPSSNVKELLVILQALHALFVVLWEGY